MKTLAKTFSLFFWLTLLSCREEVVVEEYYSTAADGKYDLVKMISETAEDLDRDGNFSSNIITEAGEEGNIKSFYLELKTIVNDTDPNKTLYQQDLDLWAPRPGAIFDPSGEFLYTKYGLTKLLAAFRYDEKSYAIAIEKNYGEGDVLAGKRLEDGSIEIRFRQKYYTTRGWEWLTINATYRKKP